MRTVELDRGRGRRSVLVLRALGIGDLMTVVPALRALRDAFPGHRIILAAPPALAPLAYMIDAVDGLVPVKPLGPLPPEAHGVDIAVNLHGRGPESHQQLLAARPRRLIAFENHRVHRVSGPRWRPQEHEVVRWCRLLSKSGIPADPSRLDLDPPGGPVPAAAVGAVVVHPGAKSRSRRWPAERFGAVARHQHNRGERVVITGSPDEAALAAEVAAAAGLGPDAVLAGRIGLATLVRVVAVARAVVCNDTGIAHLASALRTPSVVLFGPVPPSLWGPPHRPIHRALWAGRSGDPHADAPDPGLLRLSIAEVVAALSHVTPVDQAAHAAQALKAARSQRRGERDNDLVDLGGDVLAPAR